MVVDELARRHDGSFRSKFSGQLAEVRVGDLRLALLKPETYMNESGRSVGAAAAVLQGRAGSAPRRPRRRRPRAGALAGAPGRRPRRAQRPALDCADARVAGLPAAPRRRRAPGSGRPAPRRRLRAVRLRAGVDVDALSPAPPTRSRRSRATASRRRSSASTDPLSRHTSRHTDPPTLEILPQGGWG